MDTNHKSLIVLINLVILAIILVLATLLSATERFSTAGNTPATDKAVANWWIPVV